MQLTQFTDYSLRVLLYAGLKMRRSTVKEISQNFNISQNHLLKVVHRLARLGWIKSVKGAGGGIDLSPAALDLTVAQIVVEFEPHMKLLECFDPKTNTCPIMGVCKLEKVLHQAHRAFLQELSQVRIRDLVQKTSHDPRLKKLQIHL